MLTVFIINAIKLKFQNTNMNSQTTYNYCYHVMSALTVNIRLDEKHTGEAT